MRRTLKVVRIGTKKARQVVPDGPCFGAGAAVCCAGVVRDQNAKITPTAKPLPLRLAAASSGLTARLVFQLPASK